MTGCEGTTGTNPHPAPNNPNPLRKILAPFHPHLPPPCHTSSAPAAGWIANVLDQAGGRPFGICRNVRQVAQGGGGHRGSAGGRSSSTVQSQPPGRHPFSRHSGGRKRQSPVRACGGHDGPLRRVRVRAGTSRTTPAAGPGCGRSNPGGGNTPGVRGAACRMRTSSGETRAVRVAFATHYSTISRGKARVRPSGH